MTHELICIDCATVLEKERECQEWSNYKDDSGNFKNSNQRSDAWLSDNPYDHGGFIPGDMNSNWNNKLIWRIHYQQTFSHKQKNFLDYLSKTGRLLYFSINTDSCSWDC